MHLSGLFLYPVKSLRGCAVETAAVDALGFAGDRRFLVVDGSGKFLTQRALPRMALITPSISRDALTLSADGAGTVDVRRDSPASNSVATRTVEVWRSKGLLADDCGDEAAAWFSSFLGVTCRLVRIGKNFRRPVLWKRAYFDAPADAPTIEGRVAGSDLVNFADGYPFLATNEASLAELNDRLAARGEEAVPMNRFRPGLVVSGAAPQAEDTWQRLRIGGIVFRSAGPCARCIVTTTDQLTGARAHEPLRTLATYRRDAADPTNVNFGLNLVHETKTGTLRLGDQVEILSSTSPKVGPLFS